MHKTVLSRLLIILLALCCGLSGRSQLAAPFPAWKNVDFDGLKTSTFALLRDKRGIMWVGTNNGLHFYDGVTTHFVGKKELSGIEINALAEVKDRLYVGSNTALYAYNYVSGELERVPEHLREIRSILVDGHTLIIGSLNGVFIYDTVDKTMRDISSGLPHKSVYSLIKDSRGVLYAGTYDGLARYNTTENRFKTVDFIPNHVGGNVFVNCLVESIDGDAIYIGIEGGLYRYLPLSGKVESVPELNGVNVKCLNRTNYGNIIAGTDDGVYEIQNNRVSHYRYDTRQPQSLADNEIWSIYSDERNNIWAGHERGFSIASNYDPINTVRLNTIIDSGEGNEIKCIYRDRQRRLWIGGHNGVIRMSDDGSCRWYRHSSAPGALSHNRIRAVFEDSRGDVWFSTDGGLNRYNSSIDGFDVFHIRLANGAPSSNWVYGVEEVGDFMCVGSFLGGLQFIRKDRFNVGGGTVVADFDVSAEAAANVPGLPNNLIRDIAADKDGNVWVILFRDDNLIRYTPETRSVTSYNIRTISGSEPAEICTDLSGRIWCAFSGGTMVFDSDGRYKIIKFANTNEDESVIAMGAVGTGIWISTLSNLWEVDGERLTASMLPITQNAYSAVYDDSHTGKVLLGGTDKYTTVSRALLRDNPNSTRINMVLAGRTVDDYRLDDLMGATRGVTIPYGGDISLVFSTLNYSPDPVQRFMYKLADNPADTTGLWTVLPEGVNTVRFQNLKMGSYSVLVKTVGSTTQPVVIPLRVQSPPALSWWAITLYVLGALLIIAWIVCYMRRRSIRTLREHERKKELENVERKLTFLSNISHDLKTPLSMIMGPVSIMKENEKDPETRHRLDLVYSNAVRLNNLIHRTLELNRLDEETENMLIMSTFDVVDFCRGVFESFRENNPDKRFVFHTACTQLLIEADAVKFESVMTNLLSNAVKYSGKESTITCGINRLDDRVEIVVSDDGVGIAESDQPLVYQRMFRARATAELREGTGLGLYLIKKFVEAMNGTIDLYSREGQGTSFTITLPISDKTVENVPRDNHQEEQRGPKILVIEDNRQIAGFITSLLKHDYTVLNAENGRSGLAIAASFDPDVIIADEMMPIMSGLDMCRRIKQNPRLASIPIIMLTAKDDPATESASIELGIDAFMSKPFEPSALLGRISQILKVRDSIKTDIRIKTITEAKPVEAESVTEKQLARIAQVVEDNVADPDLNVSTLSEKTGIPTKQLYRIIKKYVGVGPLDYIRRVRLQKAAMLISQHRFNVSEVAYMVGFKTPSYFAKCFQQHFGVKPSAYHSDDTVEQ